MGVIFWDFDGTLAYSLSLWSGNVHKALTDVAPATPVSYWDIKAHMAYGFTWHTPEKDYAAYTNDKWWTLMNAHIEQSYIACGVAPHVALTATARVRELIKQREHYHLYDDTISTLQEAKVRGYTNVLLSNNYPDLPDVLSQLPFYDDLDGVIISAIEGYDKPRKELFDIAKSRFPSESYYMVGDSRKADIDGGNAALMTTVLVHSGFYKKADHCFDRLGDILKIL